MFATASKGHGNGMEDPDLDLEALMPGAEQREILLRNVVRGGERNARRQEPEPEAEPVIQNRQGGLVVNVLEHNFHLSLRPA